MVIKVFSSVFGNRHFFFYFSFRAEFIQCWFGTITLSCLVFHPCPVSSGDPLASPGGVVL